MRKIMWKLRLTILIDGMDKAYYNTQNFWASEQECVAHVLSQPFIKISNNYVNTRYIKVIKVKESLETITVLFPSDVDISHVNLSNLVSVPKSTGDYMGDPEDDEYRYVERK